ncbi:uncharacterized protein DSM5745_03486 [Aspergillus mulundensis]|uniref:Uncharacterized protein n=1 Tax=Aspergillus mulundensis TaxID=1810919 RepID=A0A3D8SKW1_9EURO|nr:hypothetical protein DSM5745_03486 [Aspergillus mulundensis]RDW86844.1 hypothetical protein DSM5745_03486 [Aspergillus mulundensis]
MVYLTQVVYQTDVGTSSNKAVLLGHTPPALESDQAQHSIALLTPAVTTRWEGESGVYDKKCRVKKLNNASWSFLEPVKPSPYVRPWTIARDYGLVNGMFLGGKIG